MNGEGGEGGGGSGGDDAAAKAAAEAAAAKAAEEAAAKAATDEAAKKAAEEAAGGSKKPSDEEARLLKENMKKKEALDKANAELKKTQDALKAFEGIDPEAVRKLLADQKSAEEKALEAKGDWDRLKGRMAEEHGKEIKTLQDQIAALTGKLNSTEGTIKDLSIGTQFSQSKFISEELTLTPAKTRVIYGDYFDVEEGKVVGYDKPRGAASRTAIVDQYGNTVDFESALRKIIEADPEKDHLLKSKMKPGAGSDSRKPSGQQKADVPTDGISKIASGLKGLKVL
jgi:hypothetical protein